MSRVWLLLGTESLLLGSALSPNMGLSGVYPNLVELQYEYRISDEKMKEIKTSTFITLLINETEGIFILLSSEENWGNKTKY